MMAFYNNDKFKYEDSPNRLLEGEEYDKFKDITLKGINMALSYPVKEYDIKAVDGYNLHGRYYEFKSGAPIILEFHGYKGNCVRDLAGGLQYDKKEGYNIFAVDHRGHGKSDGRIITFGINERDDVLSWVNFLNKEFNNPTIFIYGISMGGGTVLSASSIKYPDNVKGIIADCPYTSAEEICVKVAKDLGVKEWFSKPILNIGARLYGGFNLKAYSPINEIKNATLPILIIHGDADTFVPCEMSKRMKDVNPSMITLSLFEGAPHGFSCYVDLNRYFSEINEFMNKCINS